MSEERLRQIEQLYHAALEHQPQQRAAFLTAACAGDEQLRHEVESILDYQEEAESFIETPALHLAAKELARQGQTLDKQTAELRMMQSLGSYRLLSPLGRGGMGEVYLAEDSRLGRKVAIKLLSEEFTADGERVWRFEREARAASAINHPNILTIYEIGESRGVHFIAAEYVEGQTLRQLMKQSHLSLQEALDVATQVASALNAAHEAGIVHRDIKPENVMVRPDGLVKILDFGLAKLTERHTTADETQASTMAISSTTKPGLVMGTISYMSPEQARGLEVDTRTDIFSLGVVIYEMMAGRAPFTGATPSDVMARILMAEPEPLSKNLPGAPPALEQIVSRALRKDREERYQTVKELLLDLRGLKTESASVDSAKKSAAALFGRAEWRVNFLIRNSLNYIARNKAISVVALLIVSWLISFGLRLLNQIINRPAPPFQKIESVAITSTGNAKSIAISADGRYVVYVLIEAGRESLWLRNNATASVQQIITPADVHYHGLRFSQDGDHIYFVRSESGDPIHVLYRVPVFGGVATRLLTDIDIVPDFSPDGSRIVFHRLSLSSEESYLVIASADGSGEYKLATRTLYDRFRYHAWSPDGKVIVCAGGSDEIGGANQYLFEVRVTDGTESTITPQRWRQIGSPTWLSDGSGLLVTAFDKAGSTGLWRISWPDGETYRITSDTDNYNALSLTADSGALATAKVRLQTNIWTMPVFNLRSAPAKEQSSNALGHARQITTGFGDYHYSLWMPDGRILFSASAGNIAWWNLWVMNADGTGRKQLTFAGNHWDNIISRDGRYVIFCSDSAGRMNIWRINTDGSDLKQLTNGNGEKRPDCSPDNKWVFYTSVDDWSSWKVPIDGGQPVQISQGPLQGSASSPDGKWIAYFSREPQPSFHFSRIVLRPYAGGPPIRSFDLPKCDSREQQLRWTPDGQALTYILVRNGVSNIWRQPIAGGPSEPLTDFKSDRIFDFGFSSDGTKLVCTRGLWAEDVFLIKSIE